MGNRCPSIHTKSHVCCQRIGVVLRPPTRHSSVWRSVEVSELQLVTVLYSCICHPLTEAKSVAPVASPQSPSPFPFLPIPYPFRRLLRSLTTRRQEARQKKNSRFNKQSNNTARASDFFVHFFAFLARLRR